MGGAKKQSNDDDSLIICASDKIRSDQIRFQGWLLALAVGLARPTCAGGPFSSGIPSHSSFLLLLA